MTRRDLAPLLDACRQLICANEAAGRDLALLSPGERDALTRVYVETCRCFDLRMSEIVAA